MWSHSSCLHKITVQYMKHLQKTTNYITSSCAWKKKHFSDCLSVCPYTLTKCICLHSLYKCVFNFYSRLLHVFVFQSIPLLLNGQNIPINGNPMEMIQGFLTE